jgi:hypothetical protein
MSYYNVTISRSTYGLIDGDDRFPPELLELSVCSIELLLQFET